MKRMAPRQTMVVVLALAVWGGGCRRAEPTHPERLTTPEAMAELEAAVPPLLELGGVPGMSMAITTDTGLAWSQEFGVANRDTGEPVTDTTVFEAASLSKPVFAFAVLKLVDEGALALDTPISDFFDYRDVVQDHRLALITPRMVLTHTPGFPNWRPRGGELTIDREPGTEFSYSGEGFVYLQRAVMDLTGESLNDLARRLVFGPLGMTHSSYVWLERFEGTAAFPHGPSGEVLEKHRPGRGQENAAASLHTTAIDYARFMTAVMKGTGLSDSTALAMLTPQVEVAPGLSWGLGIGLQDTDEGRAFWHWGDNTGFKAFAIAYPDRGVGVVWFTNSDNGHSILEAMLAATVGGAQPAPAWLGYEAYDAPTRMVRVALEEAYEEFGLEAAIARYHEMKATQPPEAFDEFLLNSLGYRLLGAGRIQDAIAVFELNVAEYPEASNPYDSLGEACLAAGDTARAIANYQRSLELNPDNPGGRAVLERIRG